jgi:hypothetical protein
MKPPASTTPVPRPKGYFLVRDKAGKPKIDGDPRDLPPEIAMLMTEAEFATAVKEYENGSA